MSAVGTSIAMTAECGGAAACDRDQDLLMLPGDPAATAFHKSMNSTANNIGQLQRRPIYGLRICSPGVHQCQSVVWSGRSAEIQSACGKQSRSRAVRKRRRPCSLMHPQASTISLPSGLQV